MKKRCLLSMIPWAFLFIGFQAFAQTCPTVFFSGGQHDPVANETTLSVKVQGVTQLDGLQFTINWDPTLLQYQEVSDFNLPGLEEFNFGATPEITDGGKLSFAWINLGAAPFSPQEEQTLFTIKFQPVVQQAATALISFSDAPTRPEVIEYGRETSAGFLSTSVPMNNPQTATPSLVVACASAEPCRGALPFISVSVEGGAPPYAFNWGGPDNFSASTPRVENLPSGIYSLTVVDANGAQASGMFSVPPPETNAFQTYLHHSCLETPDTTVATLLAGATGGRPPYYFDWSTGQSTQSDSISTLEVQAPGLYWVTITDSEGCSERTSPSLVDCPNWNPDTSADSTQGTTTLELIAPTIRLPAASSVAAPIQVPSFSNMGGLQFSMRWDPAFLLLDSVALHPALDQLGGVGNVEGYAEGILRFAWLNSTGMGALPDSSIILTLYFTPLAQAGFSPLVFSQEPLEPEAVSSAGDLLPVAVTQGYLLVGEGLVWPGDTDSSGAVDHFDLLPLGIAYGASGPPRINAHTGWRPQFADRWEQATPASNMNYRHVDTDGNGQVEAADTLAIHLNWHRSTLRPDPPSYAVPKGIGPDLFVRPDTIGEVETAIFDIVLGTAEQPAENVYGLAFTLRYDQNQVAENGIYVHFDHSWIGRPDEILSFYRNDAENRKLHIALTRIDGREVSGSGAIAHLGVTLEDVIFRSIEREITFRIEEVRMIDRNEMRLPVSEMTTSVLIDRNVTGVDDIDRRSALKIIPQPATDEVRLEAEGMKIQAVKIYHLTGELIARFETSGFSVASLKDGYYLVSVQTDRGVIVRKLVVLH